MSSKNMSNREVCDLIFVDYATKKTLLNLNFASGGKGHPKRVQKISIKSTSFFRNFIVYGDTVMKTEDDEALPYCLVAAKCAP